MDQNNTKQVRELYMIGWIRIILNRLESYIYERMDQNNTKQVRELFMIGWIRIILNRLERSSLILGRRLLGSN